MIPRLVCYILFPFFTFLESLRNLSAKGAPLIFILFYGLYGYCQDFSLYTSDIYRVGWWFVEFETTNVIQAYKEGAFTDVYFWLLISIIRPLTSNPKIFMCVASMIYGFLTYKCLIQIYKLSKFPRKIPFYILVLVFMANISLVHMTGLRFFTAGLLYCWCINSYLLYNKKSVLFISLLTVLIHFGMIPIVFATSIYLISKKFWGYRILRFALVLSFLISFIPTYELFGNLGIENAIENNAIKGKINSYTSGPDQYSSSENLSTYRQANNIFTKFFKKVNIIGSFIILILLLKAKRLPDKIRSANLFKFTLFLFSVSFLSVSLFGGGDRFIHISWVFLLIYLSLYLSEHYTKFYKKLVQSLILVHFYSISFLFFNAPRLVSPEIWLFNLPYLIWEGLDFKMPYFFG